MRLVPYDRIEEIGKIVKSFDPKILFHTDCIQAYGKLNCYPKKWKADMISVSGHKIHGPKGIGFIYIKNGTKIKPIIWGGNQQKGNAFRNGKMYRELQGLVRQQS